MMTSTVNPNDNKNSYIIYMSEISNYMGGRKLKRTKKNGGGIFGFKKGMHKSSDDPKIHMKLDDQYVDFMKLFIDYSDYVTVEEKDGPYGWRYHKYKLDLENIEGLKNIESKYWSETIPKRKYLNITFIPHTWKTDIEPSSNDYLPITSYMESFWNNEMYIEYTEEGNGEKKKEYIYTGDLYRDRSARRNSRGQLPYIAENIGEKIDSKRIDDAITNIRRLLKDLPRLTDDSFQDLQNKKNKEREMKKQREQQELKPDNQSPVVKDPPLNADIEVADIEASDIEASDIEAEQDNDPSGGRIIRKTHKYNRKSLHRKTKRKSLRRKSLHRKSLHRKSKRKH